MSDLTGSTNGAKRHPLPSELLHDLRTPLNHIIGYSELMIEEAQADGSSRLPHLQKVRAAAQHMAELIAENFEASLEPPGPPADATAQLSRSRTADPEARLSARRKRRTASAQASEAARGSLLVVDDDHASRDLLACRLADCGYAVTAAESWVQALHMLRADTFDVVLLDIMMSDPDGFEMLRRLKADDGLKHLSVIVTSSRPEIASIARYLDLGAEDYLTNPSHSTLLHARVGASLERKRLRDRERDLFEQLHENDGRLKALNASREAESA